MTTFDPVVVTLGETMALFRATQPGPLSYASLMELGIGGAESNVAVSLVRLGTNARWLGRVGNDALGERVVRELRGEGLDVRAIVDDVAPTGLMVKESRTPDATRVYYYRAGSAGSRLEPVDLDHADIPSASLLHLSGITLALAHKAAMTVHAAIDIAQQNDIPVSFDVNHRTSLWFGRDASSAYRAVARRADIVFAGEDEARLLADGGSASEFASTIASMGPSQVVIKLGAEGCLALIDGEEYRVAAVPIRVVDTVGAGDAFVGGYLSELLKGLPALTRLDTAVRAGAFACLNRGDWEGFARRSELELLDSGEPVTR